MKRHSSNLASWIFIILFGVLIWYLFLTPTGSVKRTILIEKPKEAILSKVIEIQLENTGTVYHFNPDIYDENGNIVFYSCNNDEFIYQCKSILKD